MAEKGEKKRDGIGDDAFSFRLPEPGETYAVDGGESATSIDLAGYESGDVTFGDGILTVDMGADQAFSIDYRNVDRIQFGDVTATVLTGDHSQADFEGSELLIEGDSAFMVSIEGPGSMDWKYDISKHALSITETKHTKGNTKIIVTALNDTDLVVESLTVDRRLGSLVSDVDIETLTFTGSGRIDSIAIAGGSGTIENLHVNGQFDHDVTVSGNVTRLGFEEDLDRRADVHITGDAGTIAIGGEVHPRATLTIDGDLGSLHVKGFTGSLTVAGDLDEVVSDRRIEGSVTARGVIGPFSLDDGSGTVVSHDFRVPTTVCLYDGNYSTESNQAPADSDAEVDTGFRFGTPVPGETYVIQGGRSSDSIDLTGFGISDATFGSGSMNVDMGGGQSFSIEYSDVTQIRFRDVTAKVLSGYCSESSFRGSEAFIVGGRAFMLSVEGRGFIGWIYDSRKDTLSIFNTDHTRADTTILIRDLNGTDLNLDSVTVDGLIGSLVSNVNIGTLVLSGNGGVDRVAIRDGSGAIDTLRVTKQQFDHDFTVDGSVRFLEFDDDIGGSAGIHITGDAGTLKVGGEVHAGATFTIDGDLESLTAEGFRGELSVRGNLNTVAAEDGIRGEITARRVIGPFSLADGEGTTISHDFTESTTIHWEDGNYSTDTNEPRSGEAGTHGAAPTRFTPPDQTVTEGDSVSLKAPTSGWEDHSTSYTWIQTGGTPVTLTGKSTATPSFEAPEVLFDEDLTFQVAIITGEERTVDTVTVRVLARDAAVGPVQPVEEVEVVSSEAPAWDPEEEGADDTPDDATMDAVADSEVFEDCGRTVDAGADQTASEGELVHVSVVATDLEGEVLEYSWGQVRGTPVTFAGSGAGATFTVPKLVADEDLVFRVIATGEGQSATDTVTIHVQTDEDIPGVAAGAVRRVSAGEQVTLTHGITGSEGGSLTSNWTQTSGPKVSLGSGASTSFVAPSLEQDEDLVFQITISHGDSIVTDTVTIEVSRDESVRVKAPDRPAGSRPKLKTPPRGDVHKTRSEGSKSPAGPARRPGVKGAARPEAAKPGQPKGWGRICKSLLSRFPGRS